MSTDARSLFKFLTAITILREGSVLITLLTRVRDWTKGSDLNIEVRTSLVILATSLLSPEDRVSSWEKMAAVRCGYLVTTSGSDNSGSRAASLARSLPTPLLSSKLSTCLKH